MLSTCNLFLKLDYGRESQWLVEDAIKIMILKMVISQLCKDLFCTWEKAEFC